MKKQTVIFLVVAICMLYNGCTAVSLTESTAEFPIECEKNETVVENSSFGNMTEAEIPTENTAELPVEYEKNEPVIERDSFGNAPEKIPYSTLIQNPKIFTYTAAENETPEEAALALATLYMDDLMLPSDERTFRVTAYKKPQMNIVSPTVGFVPPNEDSYWLTDNETGENIWIVDFNASFLFTGMVSPIGHRPEVAPEKDMSERIFLLHEGSRVGFLMTKNGNNYTLQSRWVS